MAKFKLPDGTTSIAAAGVTLAVDDDGYVDTAGVNDGLLAEVESRLVQHCAAVRVTAESAAAFETQRDGERAERRDLLEKIRAKGRKVDSRAGLDFLRTLWAELQATDVQLAKLQADFLAQEAAAPAA